MMSEDRVVERFIEQVNHRLSFRAERASGVWGLALTKRIEKESKEDDDNTIRGEQ